MVLSHMTIDSERVTRIQKAVLEGALPRQPLYNGRIGPHSQTIRDPLVRLETSSGAWGIGWSRIEREDAEQLVGMPFGELFRLPEGCDEGAAAIDLPLWDLAARSQGAPLYQLLGARGSREVELYDGSIYIDDLEVDDRAAEELFRREVSTGHDYGFRNFKIKVGRGARWMATDVGLERDALVIRTVRAAAGPGAKILIDANMGNTLNTAKELIRRTVDCDVYWFEEPFAEDPAINRALKDFLSEEDLPLLIADGEFHPPDTFIQMVIDGLIDVVQYDFRYRGITFWRKAAAAVETAGRLCAPHAWGSHVERFPHAHFAASIPHYALLEASPSMMPGVSAAGWEIRDGRFTVPETPGSGFEVDPELFARRSSEQDGFDLSL